MKNKILCLITAVALAFAGISANANALEKQADFEYTIEKLSELSANDRKNIINIIYPIVIIDSGIDSLVDMIDDDDISNRGIFGNVLTEALKYADADDIKLSLNALKIIPENIRRTYLKSFINREERELSSENQKRFSDIMKRAYQEYPGLKKICEEDGITIGVLAKLLAAVSEMNENMPMLSANSEYHFVPGGISNDLSEKFDVFSKENNVDISADELISDFAEYLNCKYTENERKYFAPLLEELGILSVSIGNIYKNIVLSENYVIFPKVYAYFSGNVMSFRVESKKILPVFSGFDDISGWYENCITELAHMGIVSGRGDGGFYPNDFVTREEFVKMICAAVNLPSIDASTPFADVIDDAWYGSYIRTAYRYKLINGTGTASFGIGENISRQDAAVICYNLLKNIDFEEIESLHFNDNNEIADYAVEGVSALARIGVINGDGTGNFKPMSSITRAESAKIINEVICILVGLS